MILQTARLVIQDADITRLLTKIMEPRLGGLVATIAGDGVHVRGTYRVLLDMPFETVWTVTGQEHTLRLTLTDVHAAGLPAGALKGSILSAIASATAEIPRVRVAGETVTVDLSLDYLTFNLAGLYLETGQLLVMA